MARISLFLVLVALGFTAGSPPAHAAGTWSWPARGDVITHYRNGADPYARGQHRGIDIAAAVGRAVSAPTTGRVSFAGTAGSSGLTVSVRTADGRWDTSYLHLSSVSVREGDRVRAGSRLGAVGTTGRRSAQQPHLHLGIREAGSRHAYRDPLDFLAPLGGPGQAKPAPVGAPLPLPLKARPGAAPVPAGNRTPAPARGGVRAPAGAPGRAPVPAPHAAGSAVARALAPAAQVAEQPAPERAAPEHAAPEHAAPKRAPGRAPAAHPREAKASAPAPTGTVRAPANTHRGFDLGWALACLGGAAAALALGRPGRERGGRARFGTTALRVFGGWPTTSRPRSTT